MHFIKRNSICKTECEKARGCFDKSIKVQKTCDASYLSLFYKKTEWLKIIEFKKSLIYFSPKVKSRDFSSFFLQNLHPKFSDRHIWELCLFQMHRSNSKEKNNCGKEILFCLSQKVFLPFRRQFLEHLAKWSVVILQQY